MSPGKASFEVAKTFAPPSRNWFVLAGEIVEGFVDQGMTILAAEPEGGEARLAISNVEFLSYGERQPSAETALVIQYGCEKELERLESLALGGKTLSIR